MEVALSPFSKWTGECPYWDSRTQELSCVDACTAIGVSKIYRWNPLTNSLKSLEFDKCTSFNIPCSDSEWSVVSHGSEVLKVHWGEESSRDREVMCEVDVGRSGTRLNDGKCDRAGVLIAGTMSEESSPGVLTAPGSGSLYRYKAGDDVATTIETGFDLSNGIDWSADNSRMFFADSVMRRVFVFDYDVDRSAVSNRNVCIDFSKYESLSSGLPDGLTMDAYGRLWVACFWLGKVVQFDVEKGEILQQITLPTACTTSLCFGGPNLTDMFVTSSKFGVGNDATKGIENAGSLFKIPGSAHQSKGLDMNYFQL